MTSDDTDDPDLESEGNHVGDVRAVVGVKRHREDMLRRFSLFKDRARSIHEFNKSGKPWTMGLEQIW